MWLCRSRSGRGLGALEYAHELYSLIVLAFLTAYFTYSATVEELLMTTSFPREYASYKEHIKMLIAFVL
jgi:protein-S-isoprenylcysteine O-methyltransferase Ste14